MFLIFEFKSMCAIIGILYLLSAVCSIARIHFSLSAIGNLLGVCRAITNKLKFPYCVFIIDMDVYIFS